MHVASSTPSRQEQTATNFNSDGNRLLHFCTLLSHLSHKYLITQHVGTRKGSLQPQGTIQESTRQNSHVEKMTKWRDWQQTDHKHHTLTVHSQTTEPTSRKSRQRRDGRKGQAEKGHPAKPRRHCQNLRPKRHPQAKREAEPVAPGLAHRCRRFQGADGRHHASGHGQHGQCGQGHGWSHEGHGFGKGDDALFLLEKRSIEIRLMIFNL